MLYFKMSYHLQTIPVRGPECGAPFGGCAQHLPVIQRKEKIIMEEKNQPRRPRRSPEEPLQKKKVSKERRISVNIISRYVRLSTEMSVPK